MNNSMQITLDGTIISCLKCKKEDLAYYREPSINYANQEKTTYFKYYLLCNSCKRHFVYVRKENMLKCEVKTKNGLVEEKSKIVVMGFYDLENQPNYEL